MGYGASALTFTLYSSCFTVLSEAIERRDVDFLVLRVRAKLRAASFGLESFMAEKADVGRDWDSERWMVEKVL